MDLLDSIRILMRRWWLTLPLLLITLGGVVAGSVLLPWKYKSEATVVFLSSQLQAKQTGGNPWLAFDSSLTVTAEVVGREMMDESTSSSLRRQGYTADYKVGVAADSTGPVLVVEAEGPRPDVTQHTLEAVLRLIPTRLDEIQDQGGVARHARIRPSTVGASAQPDRVAKDKIRTLVMALFAGLVVTVGTPLLVESLTSRRRRASHAAGDVFRYGGPGREPGRGPGREPGRAASNAAGAYALTDLAKNGLAHPESAEWPSYLPPGAGDEPRRTDPRRADPRRADPRR